MADSYFAIFYATEKGSSLVKPVEEGVTCNLSNFPFSVVPFVCFREKLNRNYIRFVILSVYQKLINSSPAQTPDF